MDGATVQRNAMVASGALVSSGKTVLSGQLWSGVPARYTRDLTSEELDTCALKCSENVHFATLHAAESAKSWQQIEEDEYTYDQDEERSSDYYQKLTPAVKF